MTGLLLTAVFLLPQVTNAFWGQTLLCSTLGWWCPEPEPIAPEIKPEPQGKVASETQTILKYSYATTTYATTTLTEQPIVENYYPTETIYHNFTFTGVNRLEFEKYKEFLDKRFERVYDNVGDNISDIRDGGGASSFSELSGAVTLSQGGVGITSYTTGDLIYASNADTLTTLGAGTNGYVLTMSGGVPTWAANVGGGAANVALGAAGYIPYYSSATTSLSATSTIFIDSIGNVGIGTTTSLATMLTVTGTTSLENLAVTDLPFNIKGRSTSTGNRAYDVTINSVGDVIDDNGTTLQYHPHVSIGLNRHASFDNTANLYIERTMAEPGGVAPYDISGGALYVRQTYPSYSNLIATGTGVTTSGGTSAGNHAGSNVAQIVGAGFGDTTLELNALGGMISGLFVNSYSETGYGGPEIYPKYVSHIAAWEEANDSIGFRILHEGTPANGSLIEVLSTSSRTVFKVNGPLDVPGGTLTPAGQYADIDLAGNLNMDGGRLLTIDPLVPTTTAMIHLTGRTEAGPATAKIWAAADGGLNFAPVSGQGTYFRRGSATTTTEMFIDTSGQVGIGTTTPYANLTVAGAPGENGALFRVASSSADAFLTVNASGRVGVGTDNPTENFHIWSAGSNDWVLLAADNAGNNLGGLFEESSGDATFALYNNSAVQTLSLRANGNQIFNTGGELIVRNGTSDWIFLGTDTGGNNVGGLYQQAGGEAEFALYNGSAVERIHLDTAGDSYFMGGQVGIGVTAPSYTLEVEGTAAFGGLSNDGTGFYACVNASTGELSTSTTACGASSERFKENIVELTYGIDTIMDLRPVSFDWKKDFLPNGTPQVGLIAEEVEEVVPEVIGYGPDGEVQNLDYPKLVAVVIAALQDVWEKLTGHDEKINELEERIEELEARLNIEYEPEPKPEDEPEEESLHEPEPASEDEEESEPEVVEDDSGEAASEAASEEAGTDEIEEAAEEQVEEVEEEEPEVEVEEVLEEEEPEVEETTTE